MWLRPDHPLHALQTQAALGSHRPVLHLWAPTLDALEALWGPVDDVLEGPPQAEVIEPWGDEAWAIRCALPGLRDRWPALRAALSGEWALVVGWSDGRQVAWDRGWLSADTLRVGDLVAEQACLADGTPVQPDLARPEVTDPALEAVAAAVRAHLPAGLVLHADSGPDRVAAIVHRTTGRAGAEIAVRGDPVDLREPVLAAVAAAVHDLADGPTPLAPDLHWVDGPDMLLARVYFASVAGPALPEGRAAGWCPPEGWVVEHQAQGDEEALQDWAEAAELAGGPSRWWGGEWTPSWSGKPAPGPGGPHRVVAMVPEGLADRAPVLDPTWHAGPHRCLARWRDAVVDRDRLEVVEARQRSPRDAAIDVHVVASLAARGATGLQFAGEMPSAALIAGGRHGLEYRFDRTSFTDERLHAVLDALCALQDDELSPVGTWAHRAGRTLVRLWFTGAGETDWA